MTRTQSVLNIGNQNEMINQSYPNSGIPPSCTDAIEGMLCRLIKEQSAPDVGIEEFGGNSLNFNYFSETYFPCLVRLYRKRLMTRKVDSPD